MSSKSNPEVVVTGAYQIAGWDDYIRDRLDPDRAQNLSTDSWVLGETETISRENMLRSLKELRERYLAAYRNAWSDFLKDLDVRTPESNSEALDELQALSETPWPYAKLLKTLADNTRLDAPPPMSAAASLIDKAKATQTYQTIVGAMPERGRKTVDLQR